MAYVAQLLPDLAEARVLRQALADFVLKPEASDEEKDSAWALLAKLTNDMRHNERMGRS
jgi:hypothetical protein